MSMRTSDRLLSAPRGTATDRIADGFFLRAYCVKCKTIRQMIPRRENGRYVIGTCAVCGTTVGRTWRSLCKDCR